MSSGRIVPVASPAITTFAQGPRVGSQVSDAATMVLLVVVLAWFGSAAWTFEFAISHAAAVSVVAAHLAKLS